MNILEKLSEYAGDLIDKAVNYSDREQAKTDALSEIESFISDYTYTGSEAPTMPESTSLGESTSYDRLDYEEKSSEEIAAAAQESLAAYLNSGVNSINSAYDDDVSDLEADSVAAEESTASDIADLEYEYENTLTDINNSALKQGIARSSIVANQNEEAENIKTETVETMQTSLQSQIDSITAEIEKLETERSSALDDFDITYAVKLTDTINDLTSEQQDYIDSVTKYNNTLTEKEFDDNLELATTESDLYNEQLEAYNEALAVYEEEAATAQEEATYAKMLEVLDNLPSSDAKELVMDSEYIKENLSSYYYALLYDAYVR